MPSQTFKSNVFQTNFSSRQWMSFPIDGRWKKCIHVTACLLACGCPVLHVIHIVYHSSCLQYQTVPISTQVFNEKQAEGRWLFLSAGIPHDGTTVVVPIWWYGEKLETSSNMICLLMSSLSVVFLALQLCHILRCSHLLWNCFCRWNEDNDCLHAEWFYCTQFSGCGITHAVLCHCVLSYAWGVQVSE